MSKILFINGPASGHVNPTLAIVEELIAQGEEIVYVSTEQYRLRLEDLGATFVAYDNFLEGVESWRLGSLMPLANVILASYEVILPCVLQLAKTHSFDYLIQDSMYGCGNVAAELLNLPNISCCSSFVNAERLTAGQPGSEKESFRNNSKYVREFSTLAAQVERKFSLKRKLQIQNVFYNPGRLNLLFTSKELQPEAESLDDSYHFVGPCIRGKEEAVDFDLDGPARGKTVYISLGTIFNHMRSFYELCFKALEDFEGRVIVAVGQIVDIDSFGVLPDHFIVRRQVPQLTVLQHADLFITHGGMNSVHEAMYFSVPLIVVPMSADQPVVADRIAELGAGITLDPAVLTAEELRCCVQQMLSNADYRLNSAKLGHSLRQAGGAQAALQAINKFKIEFGISHPLIS